VPAATEPTIQPVGADDRALMDGWYALTMRCHAHDTPRSARLSRRRHDNRLSSSRSVRRAWAVCDGAEVVAAAEVSLPQHENLDSGSAHLLVAPEHRRRGLGSRLLARLAADARAAGRTWLALQVHADLDTPAPGHGFLRAVGARLGQRELQRRLDLPPADPQALRDLAASAARAAGAYRLVRWTGPTPPGWRADLAALIGRMSTDAPHGDFDLDAEHWDADRVRDRDATTAAGGEQLVVTAAQGADGRLVAYSEIAVPADGEDGIARQDDTLVAPEHRGHRLGLWIKLANLEQLAATHPQVRALETWNADENRWMIAINDAIGFVPVARVTDWELDLASAVGGPGQAGTTAAISAAASGP
jgi:GNAT superfamily N-acetyltransferase